MFFYALFWGLAELGNTDVIEYRDDALSELEYFMYDEYSQYIIMTMRAPLAVVRLIIGHQVEEDKVPEHFLQFFHAIGYPLLYLYLSFFDLANMFLAPLLAFFFFQDHNMFIDLEATHSEGEALRPKAGLPSWWSEYYALSAMQWGDYSYLNKDYVYEITAEQFLHVSIFSLVKMIAWPFIGAIMVAWGSFGEVAIYTLYAYENIFFDNTFKKLSDKNPDYLKRFGLTVPQDEQNDGETSQTQ